VKASHNVIIAGIGGQGVMLATLTLAQAAMEEYPYVVWLPSMTTAQRGGPCEATVVFSKEPIASPLVWRPQAIVVMEALQLASFLPRVQPGGWVVTESAGLNQEVDRGDVRIVKVPAIQLSVALTGDSRAANLLLLGAYIQATGVLPPSLLVRQMERRFGRNETLKAQNIGAFQEGLKQGSTTIGQRR
jgi:2-oxoglutarate ferredoxin oxidoreductase subunit gamma